MIDRHSVQVLDFKSLEESFIFFQEVVLKMVEGFSAKKITSKIKY